MPLRELVVEKRVLRSNVQFGKDLYFHQYFVDMVIQIIYDAAPFSYHSRLCCCSRFARAALARLVVVWVLQTWL